MNCLYQRDSYCIRAATEDDLAAVHNLEQQLYSTPWSERSFLFELTHERSLFWVLTDQKEIVGYQVGWSIMEAYHLHNIAVHGKHRGTGIAREFLVFLTGYLQRLALQSIELEVRASNLRAIAFYRHCGFDVLGIRRRYYRSPTEDAILMQNLI